MSKYGRGPMGGGPMGGMGKGGEKAKDFKKTMRTLIKYLKPYSLSIIVVIIFASFIYTAIKLAVTSIAFWVKFAQSYLFMVYQLSTFVKYPITIYPAWIKGILTFIILPGK